MDSYVFTGYPIDDKQVSRIGEIEYPKRDNYSSPNRIYGNLQNLSRPFKEVFHRAKSQAEAEWLRDELVDCIEMGIMIDGLYHPGDVVNNSVQIRNTQQKDFEVSFRVRIAYDINIQTR